MDIVFLSPECFPFAKASGLGDFVSCLAKNIEKEGHNLKVFIPRYGSIDPSVFHIEKLPLEPVFNFNGEPLKTMVFKGIIPDSLVSIFFIESQNHFSNSKEIYLDTADLDIENERNKFFSMACLEVISKLKFKPQIYHLFNSCSSLNARTLNERKEGNSVFTLYNIPDSESKGNKYRSLKEAIKYSQVITASSRSFLADFANDKNHLDISQIISEKKDFVHGILPGIDESRYDPETDKLISLNYSKSYFSAGKKRCKEDLLNIFSMSASITTPVFSFVGRLNNEKGAELLIDSIPHIANQNLQLIILTKGNQSYEQELVKVSNKFSNVKAIVDFNEDLSRKIYAGSDFFLNTSQSNSSVSSVLTAMKYGCIPVSYFSGTLKEILIDIDLGESSNSILYHEYKKNSLLEAILKAIKYYKNKDKWTKLVKETMSFESNSALIAKYYLKVYDQITNIETLHENVYQ